MSNADSLNEQLKSVNNNLEKEMVLKKVKEEVLKKFQEYQKSLAYMASDAPISVLCLPKSIESILISHGRLRIYDLLDCDLTEIKGLSRVRISQITSRLNEFVTML